MKNKRINVLGVILIMIFSSCVNPIGKYLITKSQKEKEIAALKLEYNGKIDQKTKEISQEKDIIISSKDNQIIAASNGLFGADQVFKIINSPLRTDLIVNNFVNESWTALGNLKPSYEALLSLNIRIKQELDSKATSLADLQRDHEKAVSENQKLVDATKIWQDKLAISEKEISDLNETYRKNLDAKQTDLNVANTKIIELQKAQLDHEKEIKEAKTKASAILGGLALLCLAGVIWSPVFKRQIAIFGGSVAFIAVAIWYIQLYMVLITAGIIVVSLIGWVLYNHNKESKLSNSLVLGLQKVKDDSKETWDKISPVLDEYLKKYTKKAGQIVTTEDASLKSLIDDKLAKFNAK